MVEISLDFVVLVCKEVMGLEVYSGVLQDSLCPCSRKVPIESVGKRALKAATEVGKDVLDGKSFKESTKSRGREVFKDLANQGANALLHQAGRGKKRRLGEHSNLSCIKRRKLLYVPADQKSRK